MQEKGSTELVGDILKEFLIRHRFIGLRLFEQKILLAWEKINSTFVNTHTQPINVKGRALFIKTDSTVLANELSLKEKELVDKLNREAGEKIIDRVIFKSGFLRKKHEKNKKNNSGKKELDLSTIKKIEDITVQLKDEELKDIMKRFLISVAKKR